MIMSCHFFIHYMMNMNNEETNGNIFMQILYIHCVKNVRIRSYFGPHLSVVSPNVEKCGPEKLQIQTLFTQ